jgi:integrase/recombinase XerD
MQNPESIKALTHAEFEALLDALNTRYASGVKNTAMFMLMGRAGLRVSEVSDLKLGEISLGRGTLRINDSKHGKSRSVPIYGEVISALEAWLEIRESDSPWVLPTSTGERTHPSSIRQSTYTYSEKAGIERLPKVSPHTLRRTFATHFLMGNKDPKAIYHLKRILGHEHISTTMVYAHMVDDSHHEAVREAFGA